MTESKKPVPRAGQTKKCSKKTPRDQAKPGQGVVSHGAKASSVKYGFAVVGIGASAGGLKIYLVRQWRINAQLTYWTSFRCGNGNCPSRKRVGRSCQTDFPGAFSE